MCNKKLYFEFYIKNVEYVGHEAEQEYVMGINGTTYLFPRMHKDIISVCGVILYIYISFGHQTNMHPSANDNDRFFNGLYE